MMNSLLFALASIAFVIVTAVVIYFKNAFTYWEVRDVPFKKPMIPAGNISSMLTGKQCMGEVVSDLYKYLKGKKSIHGGMYFINSPVYIPIDLDIIKKILISDFQHFMGRGIHFDEEKEPLSAHLFAIEGLKWKVLRKKISPTFTSGKLKMMFQTLLNCSEELKDVCEEVALKNEPVDIKEILACYTTDIIGSWAFGLELNSLKDPDAEFRKMGRRLFDLTSIEAIRMFIGFGFPGLARLLGLRVFDKKASDFFLNTIKETVDYREKNNINRQDFLQLLIQLKNHGKYVDEDGNGKQDKSIESRITFNEVAAMAFNFFLAGFETSSSTLTFCLFELAVNQDIQEKVKQELNSVLKETDGKLTYEAAMKMTYMDQVIQETLRKYPPAAFLNRKCTKTYKIPNTKLVLEEGINVLIPVLGIQWDPEYYPNPEIFDPERFNEENRAKRHVSTYLPFGEGPRVCMGLRVGMIESKVGLASLLTRFHFSLSDKTKLPIVLDPKSIVLAAEGGIWLNISKIN